MGEGEAKGKASAGLSMAYGVPEAMGQRRLARNTPGACEGLESTSYNAPYDEASLKKRAMSKLEANENVRISRVNYRQREKGKDNSHLVI